MTVETERKETLDRAQASGYLPHIVAIAQKAAVPLWWSRSSSPIGSAVLHNGTLCAVDTGKKVVCVTAGHVYSKYLEHKKEFRDLECQIGSVRIDLEDYVIDHNKEVDLATFEISPVLLAGSRVHAHGAVSWPPHQLRESDIVVLGGYPGVLRIEEQGRLGTPFVSFMDRVAQASHEHAAIQLNLEDAYWPDGSGSMAPDSEMGGLSGGPIFRFHAGPVEHFELVGVIYEANTKYGIVRARHASIVSESGHIGSVA